METRFLQSFGSNDFTIFVAVKLPIMKFKLLIFLFLFSGLISRGQFQEGLPTSLQSDNLREIHSITISGLTPSKPATTTEPTPMRAGYTIPLDRNIERQGQWGAIENSKYFWRLAIKVAQAEGLNLYIENLALLEGERLFIYNKDHSIVNGPFTNKDNGKHFVSDFVGGNEITIELNTRHIIKELPFQLGEVGVSINKRISDRDFGDSQFCEVPVNCPEGNDWQNEKRGVARILVKAGSSLWWCTGSLVNNTNNDKTPYFLTANHCGQSANETDYAAWKFYFDFESPDCDIPVPEPESVKLTGSKLLAKAPNSTSSGSDFKLLLLTDEMPEDFYPWYNGWDRTDEASQNGVCIHHPEGDIKMISTYTEAIVSVRYNNPTPNENGIYWKVNWAITQSNYGVTEGGSSGSPLFNPSGNIIGGLTGGQASCNSPDLPDYYGKFSYSWESNGSDSTRQLKYWLDPKNIGTSFLKGSDFDSTDFYADFSADTRNINMGESVQFTNLSSGNINKYEWLFPGGEPSTFSGENPPLIRYTASGNFDVKFTVSGAGKSNSKLKKAYIQVLPKIYPNPSTGKITISFGKEGANLEELQLFVYDITGRNINFFVQPTDDESAIVLDLSQQRRGMYLIRLIQSGKTQVLKVIVSK
ncbi:MAG: hypothetical protein DRI89_03405 [Bacteroidetes bacterium]|nr:MAG: hypothetical protein DRI89_03405 [Bacteroidota bacterium]